MRAMLAAIIATSLVAPSGAARAEVRVTFADPQGFTDAWLYGPPRITEDSPALAGLRRLLERLGQRLPAGQDLAIEVRDVDLAGFMPPARIPSPGIRVIDPTTWPRITLRYTLTEQGRTVASGDAVVSDMAYLQRPGVGRSTDPLRYEEPMLRDWFATQFPTAPR